MYARTHKRMHASKKNYNKNKTRKVMRCFKKTKNLKLDGFQNCRFIIYILIIRIIIIIIINFKHPGFFKLAKSNDISNSNTVMMDKSNSFSAQDPTLNQSCANINGSMLTQQGHRKGPNPIQTVY